VIEESADVDIDAAATAGGERGIAPDIGEPAVQRRGELPLI